MKKAMFRRNPSTPGCEPAALASGAPAARPADAPGWGLGGKPLIGLGFFAAAPVGGGAGLFFASFFASCAQSARVETPGSMGATKTARSIDADTKRRLGW